MRNGWDRADVGDRSMTPTEIRKLMEGVTPGEWAVGDFDGQGWPVTAPLPYAESSNTISIMPARAFSLRDARFIAAARTLVPQLLDEVERLTRERDAWIETARQHAANEEYYRGLVQRIGLLFGDVAYIADDGSRMDSVLCAKVPELVAARIALLTPTEDDERIAREIAHANGYGCQHPHHTLGCNDLTRIVSSAVAAARARQREADAEICDDRAAWCRKQEADSDQKGHGFSVNIYSNMAREDERLAAAIRSQP
jgi:hypothetical protein